MTTSATPNNRVRGERAVLLADGTRATVRRLGPADRAAVERLHAELPRDDLYRRFFGFSDRAASLVAPLIVGADSVAVGLYRNGVLEGVANFRGAAPPEMAMAVAHCAQHQGIGTLLLEALVEQAHARGVRRLVAEVLATNLAMLRVLSDSRLPVTRRSDGYTVHLTIDIPAGGSNDYTHAELDRHAHAEKLSLQPLLRPRSVALIDAGRRSESIGGALLRRLLGAGFTGAAHVVHPSVAVLQAQPCLPDIETLPDGIELAMLCVPAAAVPATADACGRRGVRALAVISAGVRAAPIAARCLMVAVRRHGMRLVGPNCLGVVNTDPAVALRASILREAPAGDVGLVTGSGEVAVAVALTESLGGLGLGTSWAQARTSTVSPARRSSSAITSPISRVDPIRLATVTSTSITVDS